MGSSKDCHKENGVEVVNGNGLSTEEEEFVEGQTPPPSYNSAVVTKKAVLEEDDGHEVEEAEAPLASLETVGGETSQPQSIISTSVDNEEKIEENVEATSES